MPHYHHDLLHCFQEQCKLKDQCYRFWLGKEIRNTDFQYAYFYSPNLMPPKEEELDNCEYFIDLKDY